MKNINCMTFAIFWKMVEFNLFFVRDDASELHKITITFVFLILICTFIFILTVFICIIFLCCLRCLVLEVSSMLSDLTARACSLSFSYRNTDCEADVCLSVISIPPSERDNYEDCVMFKTVFCNSTKSWKKDFREWIVDCDFLTGLQEVILHAVLCVL